MSLFSGYMRDNQSTTTVLDLTPAVPIRRTTLRTCDRSLSTSPPHTPISDRSSSPALHRHPPHFHRGAAGVLRASPSLSTATSSTALTPEICPEMRQSLATAVHEVSELLHVVALCDGALGERLFADLIAYALPLAPRTRHMCWAFTIDVRGSFAFAFFEPPTVCLVLHSLESWNFRVQFRALSQVELLMH
jgi:hypothetical protein